MSDGPKKILVVEDNQAMAGVVRFNLERAGLDVSVAYNGREATELIETERFDFVITDYQMPEMTGEEFCRHLRQDAQHADVPIIMCSAKGLELDREQLKKELTIDWILFKPFSPREIVEIVLSTLEQTPAAF